VDLNFRLGMARIVFQKEARANKNETSRISIRAKLNVAIIFTKQFSGRKIIEAKFPEPGGGSIWSAAG
jgi:hypothetical protein